MRTPRLGILLALLLLGACATPPVKTTEPQPPQVPPVVERRLPELPVTQVEQEVAKVEPRKLYTLAVRDADIREVLLTFGKKTDLNLVFGPDVKGTVTVDLKRVTLEEALDSLLSPIGLGYAREGNFIRVFVPAPETRIFTLSYISTTRSGGATLSATAGGAGGVTVGTAVTGGGVAAGGGGGAGASSSVTSADVVDLWGDIEKNLTNLISKDGKVVVNRTAGIVAVTDFRKNIQRIARYLELIEGSVQRQVIIEAQIVEVKLTKEYQAGINWSLIPHNLKINPLGTELRGALTGGGILGQTLAPTASLFQVGLATRVGAQTIQLLLNALSKQGTVTILSSPKISTLNNQKAVIKVATDDVFFTTTRTREPVTGLETTTVTPQTITEGIVLDVTPQIADDNTVIMNIRPSISERVGQATSPDGSIVPIIAVRATDTVVRAQDGQTVIIGGLMQHKSSRSTTGVPGMQDVPVLGGLFRQRADEGSKTELVILLTPAVVIGRRASELSPTELELLREAGGARALRR
ncbi:MAG: secretin and TonB N-terminal domain-containing protein [Candidatus Rokubacteria bacterium]|nr:secretin and TonB N-terminal domain-containing protein [Candidatus Rokubacteria bacterium]